MVVRLGYVNPEYIFPVDEIEPISTRTYYILCTEANLNRIKESAWVKWYFEAQPRVDLLGIPFVWPDEPVRPINQNESLSESQSPQRDQSFIDTETDGFFQDYLPQ